jgi:hypothetical protein
MEFPTELLMNRSHFAAVSGVVTGFQEEYDPLAITVCGVVVVNDT